MTYIEIDNINKTFYKNTNREQYVLKNLSLKIEKGDFITILGGNGAGKSTLLNAIAGEFELDSGKIMINGMNLENISESKRSSYISRVFQNPLHGTAPRMTVYENMTLALKRGEKRLLRKFYSKTSEELLKKELANLGLNLENRLNSEMGLLSGGQRQAIALLMATLKTPELLLLDEHTAALDPKTQKKIMQLTKEKIEKKNLTALMITHNIKDALEYGNRLIILNQGNVIKDFSKKEKQNLKINDIYELLYNLE